MFEFVELTNTGSTIIDLTNVAFTDGITFTFPAGTTVAPGERVIVVSDQAAFEFRYGAGIADIAGHYTGNLRNSGEHIRLEAADTTAIADFTYGDSNPWPSSADGSGYSLIFAGTDPADPLDWRPSAALGGNPGTSDSVEFTGTAADLIPYALASDPRVEILGDAFILTFHQNLVADDAEILVEFSTDLITWTMATTADLVSRINQGDGTALQTFQGPLPISSIDKQFARVRILQR